MKKQKFANFFVAYKDYFYSILTAIIICTIIFVATFIMREQLDVPKSNPKNENEVARLSAEVIDLNERIQKLVANTSVYATNDMVSAYFEGDNYIRARNLAVLISGGTDTIWCTEPRDKYPDKISDEFEDIYDNNNTSYCVDLTKLFEKYPWSIIDDYYPTDKVTHTRKYVVCLWDTPYAGDSCPVACSMTISIHEPGYEYNCVKRFQYDFGWTDWATERSYCDKYFEPDTSREWLQIMPNHQQGLNWSDTRPHYKYHEK